MNKRIVLIIMVLLGIVLTGCPNLAGEDSGGSQISGDFIKAPGLIFSTGEKEGEIQYSWTTASPAGGVNYILYIAAGSKTRAREIQSEGKAENTGISTGSGVFTGVEGEMYSAVVMAVKGTSRAYSAVAQAKAKSFYFTGNPDPSSLYDLRFGVISDTHIGATTRGNTAYPNIQRFNKVLKWYSTQPNVKALAIVGDITDTGVQTQWDTVKNSLEANMGNLKLIAVMGNHDAYPSDKNAAANAFEGATGQKTNAHYVVDGYHFIVLNAGSGAFTEDDPAGGGAIASGRTSTPGASASTGDIVPSVVKDWARVRIDMAKAANPGKPIFVFLHWPIQNTFYVSDEWYTSSFGSNPSDYFFKDDPEVVVFGGHIHSPNSDPRSIWQDGFTSVNTATLHYMEMEAAGSPKKYLGDSSNGISTSSTPRHPILRDARTATGADIGTYTSGPAAQGMIVSVKGSEVIIENFDFDVSTGPTNNVEKIPQTWKFDVAHPESFPYTQTKRTSEKAAPLFDASTPSGMAVNGKIRIVQAGSTSIIVNFDQARMPSFKPDGEVVHSYRFEIWNKEPVPSLERTAYQWSDFMYTPRLQKTTYTQLLGGLQAGTEYELRIYAYGSFQECSAQYLTVDFTTAESVNFDIKFQNNLLNASSPPARVSVTGMASYDNGVRTGEKAIKLNGNNYIQLDRAAPSFNYSQSFTIAFWVKVISTRGSDPVIFSNKSWSNGNNNGFLLMVKGNNILLNSKSVSDSERLNGSSDISIASGAGNVWTHIAVVYDKTAGTNGEVRYYKDGNVVGTLATNLTNGIDGGQHSYLGQSANGDLLYQGSSGSYDVEFLMQDFLLSGGALLDSEIQNLATP